MLKRHGCALVKAAHKRALPFMKEFSVPLVQPGDLSTAPHRSKEIKRVGETRCPSHQCGEQAASALENWSHPMAHSKHTRQCALTPCSGLRSV